jgi:hypothetical protein
MWLLLKGLALRFIVGRTLGGMMGALLVLLVPIAGILKFIGLPILLVLGLLGAPLFLLLGAIGLPMLFVLGIGAVVIMVLGVVLALGVLAIKFVLPIVLIVWFVRWVWRALRRSNAGPPASATGPIIDPETGPIPAAD